MIPSDPTPVQSGPNPPEDWNARVVAAIDTRREYLRAIELAGPAARKFELEVCAADPVHWISSWVWMLDPRSSDVRTMPFVLWPKQEELVRWIVEREKTKTEGTVEKCRDWGVSVICIAYALHGWLFRPGFIAGFGSRKDEYVDRLGDMKSIFEKARFILGQLPYWMIPGGFDRRHHDKQKAIINPDNGSSLVGESGDGIGRGGRTSIYIVDEAAFIEHPELMERSLLGNTEVRIDVSTPNGPATPFAKRCRNKSIAKYSCDWRDDPRKNRQERLADGRVVYPWYEEQKARYDPVTIAQELDRDHDASVEGICIPAAWVRAAIDLKLPKGGWAPTCAGLDVGEEGSDLSVWIPRYGPIIGDPVSWGKSLTTDTAYRARDLTEQHLIPVLNYDAPGVGAGIKGILQRTDAKLKFRPVAVNTGGSTTEAVWPDGQSSSEKFANLKAELWWMARTRFEKTYEYVVEGKEHPLDELISIPDHQELRVELSQPLVERTETGKIRMERKEAMRRRGIKSPNYADSLVLCFFPVPRKIGVW